MVSAQQEAAEVRQEEDVVHREAVEAHPVVEDREDSAVVAEAASEAAGASAEEVDVVHQEAEAEDTRTLYMMHWRRRQGVQIGKGAKELLL